MKKVKKKKERNEIVKCLQEYLLKSSNLKSSYLKSSNLETKHMS